MICSLSWKAYTRHSIGKMLRISHSNYRRQHICNVHEHVLRGKKLKFTGSITHMNREFPAFKKKFGKWFPIMFQTIFTLFYQIIIIYIAITIFLSNVRPSPVRSWNEKSNSDVFNLKGAHVVGVASCETVARWEEHRFELFIQIIIEFSHM